MGRISLRGWPFIVVILLFAGDAMSKGSISSASLGRDVPVIGTLGQPLGRMMTIRGRIIDGDSTGERSLSGTLLLKVASVNGKRLAKPVIMPYRVFPWISIPEVSPGMEIRYIGYESGEMTGIPEEAFKHMPRVATMDYHFAVYFQVCGLAK